MAGQIKDMVLPLLRPIQETLADHTRRFDLVDSQLTELERQLGDVNDGMITALGLASHAHVRHESKSR